ncbi:MAG: mechanosensitive ion channel family protein [Desulfotomaculales bacterium]
MPWLASLERGQLLLLVGVILAAAVALSVLDVLRRRSPDAAGARYYRWSEWGVLVLALGTGGAVYLSYAGFDLSGVAGWLVTGGLRVVAILALTVVAVRAAGLAVDRFAERLKAREEEGSERVRQIETMAGVLRKAAVGVIFAVAGVTMLKEFGVDIRPIITAAGIGGLAIGFGAQTLVRDLIGGLFLLLENQVRVGDVVRIGDKSGQVEAINLRTIILRDLDGVVHIIPHGSIESISNMTREWSRYVIDVGVAYKEDVDHVIEVLRQIGDELARDPDYAPDILKPLEVLGVDRFADSAVVIRVMITTRPLRQWVVGRELRRRIKKRFDELGIEIPFPHLTLYYGGAGRKETGDRAGRRPGC